jgi:hypothetical protein
MTWLLLIYTIPAQPPGKRAAVWRAVKRSGAIYLRDGVCALPDEAQRVAVFEEIALKIREQGGQATVARVAELGEEASHALLDEAREARAAEYHDLKREVEAFALHIKQERQRREFSFAELEQLEGDLAKLRRWAAQIAAREFQPSTDQTEVPVLLDGCESLLAGYLVETYQREETGR